MNRITEMENRWVVCQGLKSWYKHRLMQYLPPLNTTSELQPNYRTNIQNHLKSGWKKVLKLENQKEEATSKPVEGQRHRRWLIPHPHVVNKFRRDISVVEVPREEQGVPTPHLVPQP